MQFFHFTLLALSTVSAYPASSSVFAPFFNGSSTPRQWQKQQRASSDTIIPVKIALTQQNLELGSHYLQEISDPKSSKFGKFWTPGQINDAFAPSEKTTSSVRAWLADAGISNIATTASGGYLKFNAAVSQVEKLLQTEYHVYKHTESGDQYIKCIGFQLPEHLKQSIDFITPTTSFPRTKLKRTIIPNNNAQRRAVNASCAESFTPSCIKSLYNIPSSGTNAGPSNNLGIVEFGQSFAQSDLDKFYSLYSPNIPASAGPANDLIDGTQPAPGLETALNLQIAFPIIYPQNISLLQTANNDGNDYEELLDSIDKSYCQNSRPASSPKNCGIFNLTSVLSISYGGPENSADPSISRECQEFMKLGLQGVSVLASSGDGGVADNTGQCGPNNSFFVSFPASCPYVTAVGGTQLSSSGQEVAMSIPRGGNSAGNVESGGGFSGLFAQPSYQSSAVSGYISSQHLTASPQFNISGRAYPDIAAIGGIIQTVSGGQPGGAAGTSASAPLVASMVTLVNGQRMAKGKGPVGFLNPTLYQNAKTIFNDVTQGSNPGCGGNGFTAAAGWDPVTGLGTPDYQKLLNALKALP